MRKLYTGVFALLALASSAQAENTANAKHPVIGDKTPNVLLSRDILALPERERLAWIHGAVSLMAQTAASREDNSARCVMDWYFKLDETPENIMFALERYPDRRASSIIFTLAGLACENF